MEQQWKYTLYILPAALWLTCLPLLGSCLKDVQHLHQTHLLSDQCQQQKQRDHLTSVHDKFQMAESCSQRHKHAAFFFFLRLLLPSSKITQNKSHYIQPTREITSVLLLSCTLNSREASNCCLKLTEKSMDDYTEPWLKINETFDLFKYHDGTTMVATNSVATIKPPALLDYNTVLTIASFLYP